MAGGPSALLVSLALVAAAGPRPALNYPSTALPPRLDEYLASVVKLDGDERRRLLSGAPVTKLLPTADHDEVAVFGAIWIAAPMRRYVELASDIERFERGASFKITRRISEPPVIDDFAELRLPADDFKALRKCRVGDCDVKLGERALQRFRAEIDWKSPEAHAAADRLMRQIALEYVTGYLEGGNERLAIYRDKALPTEVAAEFRSMAEQMPELTSDIPDLRRYLLEFPSATLPGTMSFLYWQETTFGLKPTIRISHVTIREGEGDTVVASKMLYASHYFWSGLELRVLLADPSRGTGFWFVTINRSRSDGMSGLIGRFVRGRVRSGAREGTLTVLRNTRLRLERTP